jgi:type II secretory pathway component GspD/PulD (secretin)
MKPRQTMHHTTRSSGPRRALAGTLLALAGLACGAFAAAQPAGEPEPVDAASVEPVTQDSVPGPAGEISNGDDPEITFSETAEPMELTALVDFVAQTLRINISVRGELKGSVLFNTSKSVRLSKLLPLLDAMLEQNEFSITYDQQSEFYQIQPKSDLGVQLDGELATTKLIEIPNIKPSSLSEAIAQILGGSGSGTQAAPGGVTFIDELGLIIITNSSRQIARVEALIERILARTDEIVLTPIELQYISASTARDRLISLAGGTPAAGGNTRNLNQQLRGQVNAQNQGGNIGPTAGSTIENIAERLAVDPQSNALLFRGTPDELERVLAYVEIIDVDNNLPSKRHFVGSAARQIAELASGRGLGEVVILEDTTTGGTGFNQFGANRNFQQQGNQFGNQTTTAVAGPTLVVDVRNGEIVYYGTVAQQAILESMISELDTEADRVVIRQYRLDHAVAEEVAETIQTLLQGQSPNQGGILPQSRGLNANQFQPVFDNSQNFAGGAGDEIGDFDPTRVFVVADTPNNQVIVKAPVKQQDDLAQLIEKLDLRRRQVFIEVLIVSIDDTEDFRFALETQFQIGQYRGQTNFGLSEAGTDFIDTRSPISTLGGLTSALIKTEYLPVVINAVKNETEGRILSRPQLLVNDNEEASIISVEERQTQTTSQGDNSTIVGVGEPVTAGTTLAVTPGISEAGFLRLEYEITFDNFIGSGTDTLPPPANRREVNGSVTMPTDTTIVVGGLTVENSGSTVVKIPILGDIPLIGPLFADTRENDSNSVLYIFITPKILVDPDFRDLRLLSRGPQYQSGIDVDLPPLEPIAIERISLPARPAGGNN